MDNFPRLYARIKPPERTRVWIGAMDESAELSEVFVLPKSVTVKLTEDGPASPVGYHTLLRLKRVVFLVSGWNLGYADDVPDFPNPGRILSDAAPMIPIWPTTEMPVRWPPATRLAPDDIDRLIYAKP
jgi:hypothetical protein